MKESIMVFELTVWKATKKNEWYLFIYSFVVTCVAFLTAYYIFPAAASVVAIFFIVIVMLPAFYRFLITEEEYIEELCCNSHVRHKTIEAVSSLFERNRDVIIAYTYLFIGVAFASTLLYTFLPSTYLSGAFSFQKETLHAIRGDLTSPSIEFVKIFFNNLRVSFVAFLLSFFFGTGALFVITWNATIVGVFFGELAREFVERGLCKGAAAILAFLFGSASIMLHAVPEITAYFLAGIAGGILSLGVYRSRYTTEIIEDSLAIYLSAVAFLLVAAFIEAYITPII